MGYSVLGNKVLHDNNEIQLFGVNVCGAELNDGTISGLWSGQTIAEMVGRIKAQGFNCVRIPIGQKFLQNVTPDPGLTAASQEHYTPTGLIQIYNWLPGNAYLKGKKSLEVMDYWLAEFEKQGLRYIFDWHYLENGKIPDLWYTQSYSEQQWLSDLKAIASRYKGRAGFVGIDIKNEPNSNSCTWGDGSNRDWKLASEKAFQAINSVNQDIIILVEWLGTETGIGQMVNNPLNIPSSRLALSVHIYFSDVWGQYVRYFDDPNYPNNLPAVWDKMLAYSSDRLIIVGEWGGKFGKGKAKDKTDQEAFARYLLSRRIFNFCYWQWGENSGDTGGILADGTWKNVRADKVQMLYTLKTSLATYLGDSSAQPPVITIPDPVQPTPVTPTPSPVTPTPSNPVPTTPVQVTFPSSMHIDNFPSVQKVSLDRDIAVQFPGAMSINNLPQVQKVEVTNPTPVTMPNSMHIDNFPQVQQVQVLNPANVSLPSSMAINNFPTEQAVRVVNPSESGLPENLNVNLTGMVPNIGNFIIPDVLKVLLEGSASGGGGSTNVPSEFTVKQTLTHVFPVTLPQLTVNLRNVAPSIVAPSTNPKAFPVGSVVFMVAAPTIKMVVERHEGDTAVCRYSNDMDGLFATAYFSEVILRLWQGT